MDIVKNSVVELSNVDGFADGQYRVLEILSNAESVILFSLEKPKTIKKPQALALSLFKSLLDKKNIIASRDDLPSYMLVDEDQISAEHRKRRDNKYLLIKGLVSNPVFLFDYATQSRVSHVAELASSNGIDRKTLYRLLNLFWTFGQDRNAFLPAYSNSGGKGKQRTAKNISLGAPKSSNTLAVTKSEKYILKQSDKENIRKILKKHFLKPFGLNLKQTYEEFLRTYYSEEIRKADACRRPPLVPSVRQFRYWNEKLFSANDLMQSRTTESDYLLNKRGLLGSSTEKFSIPGSCFEIDATVADVHIVSSIGKQYALGRPTIYSIVDRASRMIVGFHVSLYHASWRAARQALVNCFLPKAEYCRQYGVLISDAEWPCAHIPQRLMCDNGEMIGLKPQNLLVPFTELQFAPAYRPDFKGIVEQRFNILNNDVLHRLLGTTRGGTIVRGMKDPRKDSIYTLREVTKLLIEAVLEHNKKMFDGLARSSSLLIGNDLPPTPINFWNIHLREHKHALKKADFHEVIARLMLPAVVSMTRDGIEYKGMYYSCDEVVENNLASLARTNGRWKLDARIDENTTDHIFVRFDSNERFVKCSLLLKSQMLKNSTMHDAEFVQDWLASKRELAPVSVTSIDWTSDKKQMEKDAKLRSKESKLSFSEKTKNTREHRKAELAHSQGHIAIDKVSQVNNAPIKDNSVSYLPRRNKKAGH